MDKGRFRDPRVIIFTLSSFAFSYQVGHLFDQRYVNPTNTETKIVESSLQDLHFPVIFKICILPGFDLEELHSAGYDSPRSYFLGQGHFTPADIGWAGHSESGSSIGTVADIRDRVSTNPWTVLKIEPIRATKLDSFLIYFI